MGVETILLIVILAFAAGVVLDRLAIRRGRFDAARSKKETVSDFTSSPNQACYLAITRTANLRHGKPRPAGSSPRAENIIASLLAAAGAGTISDVTTARAWTGAEFKAIADKASKAQKAYRVPGKK